MRPTARSGRLTAVDFHGRSSQDAGVEARRGSHTSWLAALAIAAVAIALRVWGLGRESLWLDEGFTWRLTRLPLRGLIEASRADVHPPLHPLLVKLLVRFFGDCETTLRAVSVAASCAAVFFTWRLARRAFGETAAWGAAALVALSAFQVRYAQEARPYALLGALSLASADGLLAVLADGRPRARIGWAAATLTLLYTHAHGLFVVFAEALVLAGVARTPAGRGAARRLLVPAAVVFAGFLPWASVLVAQARRVQQSFWIARPVPFEMVRTLHEFAGSGTLLVLLASLVLLAALRRPSAAAARPADDSGATAPPNATAARALVLLLALVPLFAPYVISLAGPAIYLTRAAIASSLALAILAAAGWAGVPSRVGRALVALLVVAASVPPLLALHRDLHKEPWRDAVAWLERGARPGDLVLVTAPWYRDGVFAYYAKRHDLDARGVPAHEGAITRADIGALAPALARRPRVWLVRARTDDPGGLLPAALAAGRDTAAHREWLVSPQGLTRSRSVRALDIICYAAPAFSAAPADPARPVRSAPAGR